MSQQRPASFTFFCQLIKRQLGVDLQKYFQNVDQLLQFLYEIFELYDYLKRKYFQTYQNRIQELWLKYRLIIWPLLTAVAAQTNQNIFDFDVRTAVLNFISQFVGGIPIVIQVLLMYLYFDQIRVLYENRSILRETISQFTSFENQITNLYTQTQELEKMIFQYANNESNQQELLEQINDQFETLRTIDESEICRKFELFRHEIRSLLKTAKNDQNELRKKATLGMLCGFGSTALGIAGVIPIEVTAVSAGISAIFGATALFFDSQVSKDIEKINKTLNDINSCENLALETLRKIAKLDNQQTGTTLVKVCFKYAFWILLFVKLYDQFQNPNQKMFFEM